VRLAELWGHIAEPGGKPPRPGRGETAARLVQFLAAASRDAEWGVDEDFFRERLGDTERPCILLLDGLDEAPDRPARESLSRLIENVGAAYEGCRVVVTTRPGAYADEAVLPGFAQVQIEPLAPEAVRTFLERWCQALWGSAAEARAHRDELLGAVQSRAEIGRMARNPVMLTALAVVHWNERRLPEQRADLYDSIIRWLSRSREWRPGRETADRCVYLLQELALAMQNHPDGRQAQVARRWAAEAIAVEFGQGDSRARTEQAECFPEDVSQEAHQNVRPHSSLRLMPDGT
jgi:hypothetical protein